MTDKDRTDKVTIEHTEDAQPEKETQTESITLTDSAEVTIEHKPTEEPEED